MSYKGIGEDGKSLREILKENDKRYEATGCYAGIKEPSLLRTDPVKAELFHSRIIAALISGQETTKMISGSPMVREVSELCIGLYTSDGDNVAQSAGIQTHVRPMGDVIKWMIKNNYEEEVGIQDGDLFCSNDPFIGGMHTADVYDILPVFYDGELVSWVCTAIMELDIGAVTPNCMPVADVERSTDGLRFCAEKVGSDNRLRRDIELKIELSLDMPQMFMLDRKGAIAANMRIRDEVKEIIREFGLDYYKLALRELIEEERRNQMSRIRQQTVPGRYRNMLPFELYMASQPVAWLPARRDVIRLVPIQMDILPSGRMVLDFEGTGEWGWHPFNCFPSAMWGGLSLSLVQSLSWDGRSNLGALLACDMKLPLDSLVNPSQLRLLATANVWASLMDIFGQWLGMLGIAHYLRGFREETFSFYGMSGWTHSGYDQFGIKRPLMYGSTGHFGPGARGVADGVNVGGTVFTPQPDMGNSEVWELFIPFFDLSKKLEPYSVGYGRFRSGLSISTKFMAYGTRLVIACATLGTLLYSIPPNAGMFGGYPSGKHVALLIRNTNIPELIEKRQPLLHEFGHPANPEFEKLIKGEVLYFNHMPPMVEMHNWDITISDAASGGGLGDPIERDSSLIINDLDNGLTTSEIVKDIYCAKASFDPSTKEWKIDEEATAKMRDLKRKERLGRAIPARQWWNRMRQRLTAKDLDDKLLEMYQNSMNLSKPFAKELRDFWALPEDFAF